MSTTTIAWRDIASPPTDYSECLVAWQGIARPAWYLGGGEWTDPDGDDITSGVTAWAEYPQTPAQIGMHHDLSNHG